jgi:3' terminal RNA ribose 2'-O-methyltransferase Hen1
VLTFPEAIDLVFDRVLEIAVLLTISTTHRPATDLGYLLGKNPNRTQSFELAFGAAHVMYAQADEAVCTAALLLELDPVGLVRGRSPDGAGTLASYVNDRPYVASSFMSVAIAQVFGSALNGRSRERPELAGQQIPLTASISALPCRGGHALLERLFVPLGYSVSAQPLALDEQMPEWGQSPYYKVTLRAQVRLQELLSHLYVLLPVLDRDKHYWVGEAELQKLLDKGEGWLASHPEKAQIAQRYLRDLRALSREALARLADESTPDPDVRDAEQAAGEDALERRLSLDEQRLVAVTAALRAAGARRVLDAGCGEGKLLQMLLRDSTFELVAGADVSTRALEWAAERLKLDQLSERQRQRIQLFQASLTYRDARFAGFDALCCVEVIEHLDPWRLPELERVVFKYAQPATVIVTTPNIEYNVRFAGLAAGRLRHGDHRFEWDRQQFVAWSDRVAAQHGYTVARSSIGPVDAEVGSPTQLAVFSR